MTSAADYSRSEKRFMLNLPSKSSIEALSVRRKAKKIRRKNLVKTARKELRLSKTIIATAQKKGRKTIGITCVDPVVLRWLRYKLFMMGYPEAPAPYRDRHEFYVSTGL